MPRQARRIDRKSLKQDPLLNFTTRVSEYVNANATLVLGIAAAVVAGVVLLVMWGRGHSVKTEQSDTLAIQAIGMLTSGQFQRSLDQATTIRTQFPHSRGAAIAAYAHAKSQLQLGAFVDAERGFREYLSESSKEPFFEQAAKSGLAASLEGQRRFSEAGQVYEELAAQSPEALADQALLDAARAYELGGSTQQARSLLERVLEKDGLQSRQARVQLAALDVGLQAIGEGRVPEPLQTPAADATGDTKLGAAPDAATDGSDGSTPEPDAGRTP